MKLKEILNNQPKDKDGNNLLTSKTISTHICVEYKISRELLPTVHFLTSDLTANRSEEVLEIIDKQLTILSTI